MSACAVRREDPAAETPVAALRSALASQFPDALPLVSRTVGGVATGVRALDGLLPNGGLPRSRLSVWQPGGGATAVLRSVCGAAVARGERSAWVDGAGVVTGEFWAGGVLLLRPRGEVEALECGEELARSGGFTVVVLTGAGRGAAERAVRLSRSARSGGCALVVVGGKVPVAALRVASRLVPASYEWWRDPFGSPAGVAAAVVEVRAEAMGWSGRTRFRLPVFGHAGRLGVESMLPDRRGVASDWTPASSVDALLETGVVVGKPAAPAADRGAEGASSGVAAAA